MEYELLVNTLNSVLALFKTTHSQPGNHEQFQALMRTLLILQKKGEIRDLSDDFSDEFYGLVLLLLQEGKRC